MNTPRASRIYKRAGEKQIKFQMQKNHTLPEILLIEDGSGLFTKIREILQNRGFHINLAPDADSAMELVLTHNFAAVIAGASQNQTAGLKILAVVKDRRPDIKTLVVTSLAKPELPIEAYEMEIDDYIHWPLNGPELIARLKSILGPGDGEGDDAWDLVGDHEFQNKSALNAMGSLVEGFTTSLTMISRSLQDIRREHLKDMGESLSAELFGLAAQVQQLCDNMQQCWKLGAAGEPVGVAKEQRFH